MPKSRRPGPDPGLGCLQTRLTSEEAQAWIKSGPTWVKVTPSHFSVALVLSLGACAAAAPKPTGEPIDCALDSATAFAKVCTVEQAGNAIVVRRPDGGFRRVVRTAHGMGTDGSDDVAQSADGTVRIGQDRYRLPQ